jgi:hypothetical protein
MTVTHRTLFTIVSLFSLILAGCGGSDRPSLAPASGIVKLDGVPVEGASVTYLPSSGGRPGSGVTDAAGRYTIKTFEDAPGAIVGDHKVSVMKISGPGADVMQGDAPAVATESGEDDGADGLSQIEVIDASETEELEVIYDVPQKYMNSNDSGLELTVPPEGSDTLNLDLTK